jgi:hypothetical protein
MKKKKKKDKKGNRHANGKTGNRNRTIGSSQKCWRQKKGPSP